MKGIVITEFEKMINQTSLRISNIMSDYQALRSSALSLKRNTKTQDLAFLTSGLNNEISEMSKVIAKFRAYETTMRNILRGYNYQGQEISNALRQNKP